MLRKSAKKVLRFFWQSLVIGFVTLLLFEVSFRLYLIDFYKGSFDALNSDFGQRDENLDLMIIGDSFSAFKDGYPKVLFDSLPDFNVHNISIAGTSVREQYLFGRHHLKKENPDILIFQFYIGNDFVGWEHHLNWEELSWARNSYWRLSENFWSLAYLNHRLSRTFSKTGDGSSYYNWINRPFSPELYTERDKIYFKSEPELVENAAYLKGGREGDFQNYMERTRALFNHAPADCNIYFLIIPHASQVNNYYKQVSEDVGGVFSEEFVVGDAMYPLGIKIQEFFSDDSRVRVLSIVKDLARAERNGSRVYFNNDSHLNSVGQKLVARKLLRYLKE